MGVFLCNNCRWIAFNWPSTKSECGARLFWSGEPLQRPRDGPRDKVSVKKRPVPPTVFGVRPWGWYIAFLSSHVAVSRQAGGELQLQLLYKFQVHPKLRFLSVHGNGSVWWRILNIHYLFNYSTGTYACSFMCRDTFWHFYHNYLCKRRTIFPEFSA